MKKKEKKKFFSPFYVIGSLILTVISFLIMPIILDKGTDIAYKLLYPDDDQ